MATCRTKRFPRTAICAGDRRHKLSVERREIQAPDPLADVIGHSFTVIGTPYAALKQLNYPAKLTGVNTDELATHRFFFPYATKYDEVVERNNYFIRYKGRLMQILRFGIFEEDDRYMVVECTERGVKTLLANEA
jgi:hypothetical protein